MYKSLNLGTHQIEGYIENLSIWRQNFWQTCQVEFCAIHLHPQWVIDVDYMATAIGRTARDDLLQKSEQQQINHRLSSVMIILNKREKQC